MTYINRGRPRAKQTWLTIGIWALVALSIGSVRGAMGQAGPTKVTVRVVAHDAKIIGSGVGGARVTIRDAETGATLAQGVQEGSTGNTERIMRTPRTRGVPIFDTEGAARFVAQLNLTRPTVVEIVAEGPLDTPHSMQRASKTSLIVPGQDVTGDGIVLELMGFTVVFEDSTDASEFRVGHEIPVRVGVTMLCGCPTEPGGMWDADQIDVTVRMIREGVVVAETPLEYAGSTSTFSGRLTGHEPGAFELQVIAQDPDRANFGWVARPITVLK